MGFSQINGVATKGRASAPPCCQGARWGPRGPDAGRRSRVCGGGGGARTTLADWIGIRVEDFVGSVDGRERKYHSTKAAVDTLPGLRGMVLYVDFTPPVIPGHASLIGSGVSEAAFAGAGSSEAALAGAGTSASSIAGAGDSEHAGLTGTGTSRKSLRDGTGRRALSLRTAPA